MSGSAVLAARIGLRLDRHQRARDEDVPTITVLAGTADAARARWEQWLEAREQPSVWLELDDAGSIAPRLAAAILARRAVLRDVAAFVARHTGEPIDELESRLRTQGRPERARLLDHVASASRLPDVVRLASRLLEAPSGPLPAFDGFSGMGAVVAALQLLPPDDLPGLGLAAPRLAVGLPLVQAIVARLPRLPVALAVEPAEVERFLAAAGSGRDPTMVREGLVRLDELAPAPAHAELPPRVEALRRELRALSREAPDAPQAGSRARSLAEQLLYEALQANPATHGRFALNVRMPFGFGRQPAEVDLFSVRDRVAIEIDGYYHFVDDDAYRRDRRKDVLLQRHGLFVLRFLARDVGDRLTQIIDSIVDVLHRSATPEASE